MTGQVTAAEWVEAIATRTSLPVSVVQEALDRHGVEPQSTLPRRKTLRIRSVRLAGLKEGTAQDGPFDQAFAFGPGLWAVLSDQNFRGKSTLLNAIEGGIRGDLPERIKPDIWRWISRAEVTFQANGIGHRVTITKEAGRSEKEGVAEFSREQDGLWLPLYEGPLGQPLERAVDDAMLAEFGFARFQAHNEISGTHTHGWPAIASALFVSGPGKAVFGEVLVDGIPLRLLQMFMGLPWVSTYTVASSAHKRVKAALAERARIPGGLKDRLSARLKLVVGELELARAKVRPGPDRVVLRSRIVEGDGRLVILSKRVDEERQGAAKLASRLQGARAILTSTRRSIQQIEDDRAAGVVFRSLRPVCCPSCDAGIDRLRHDKAEESETCALCGSVQVEADDETGSRLQDLRRDAEDVAANVARLVTQVAAAQASCVEAEQDLTGALSALRALEDELSAEGAADLELEIRGLEAQEEQLRALMTADEETPDDHPLGVDDERVLKAAEEVTKTLYDDLAREILSDVSQAITRLSRSFGVENVERMDWGTGGQLRIVQGNAPTSFTKLAPGENLRVRIAAALAVVEVSRKRLYGRHPGLLVLDSPAAQEMAPEDFSALMASVQDTIEGADDIQVIVGAVARPELVEVVPLNHTFHAPGEQFLF